MIDTQNTCKTMKRRSGTPYEQVMRRSLTPLNTPVANETHDLASVYKLLARPQQADIEKGSSSRSIAAFLAAQSTHTRFTRVGCSPPEYRSGGADRSARPYLQTLANSTRQAPSTNSTPRKRKTGVLPSWGARLRVGSLPFAPNSVNPRGSRDARTRQY